MRTSPSDRRQSRPLSMMRAAESGGAPNYHNSHTRRTVKPQLGQVEIQIPRVRNGSFEAEIIGR